MTTRTPGCDTPADLLQAALTPYAWRSFTPGLLARFVVAAHDRVHLRDAVLGTVAGASVGAWEHLAPAAPDDPRLALPLTFLASHRWTGLRLSALCRSLTHILDEQPA